MAQAPCPSSSTGSPTLVYLGADVASNSIDCRLLNRSFTIDNRPKGFSELLAFIQAASKAPRGRSATPPVQVQVLCEETGRCHYQLVHFLNENHVPVSILNPGRVRALASAAGKLAKTDPIDARVLVDFGRAFAPAPTPPLPAHLRVLRDLLGQLDHFIAARAKELNRLQQLSANHDVRRAIQDTIKFFSRQIEKLQARIQAQHDVDPNFRARVLRLTSIIGIGEKTAVALLTFLPELGTLNRRTVAALAGLAPHNRDSGQYRGQRHISGGRANVRTALWMPVVTACRFNPSLKSFYQRLRDVGKSVKLARIATARKLLILLNALLKNPNFSLAD